MKFLLKLCIFSDASNYEADFQAHFPRDSVPANEPFVVYKTSRGRNLEDSDGYTYSLMKAKKCGLITWRCSKRRKGFCKAQVITVNDVICRRICAHNHPAKQFIDETY